MNYSGKKLHIISFDIPYPPVYGGVIDVFYKLKNLFELGIEITLHCFMYGEGKPQSKLNEYCKHVYYYPRTIGIRGMHFALPYIVASRNSKDLLRNLLADDAPILFEGIHTTFFSKHPLLAQRIKFLRAHNIESLYYKILASDTKSLFGKLYFYYESYQLRRIESSLNQFDVIFSISEHDEQFFNKTYPTIRQFLIPAFHQNEFLNIKTGIGDYCLYHGNLSVPENIKTVHYLVNNIFRKINIPLIITGKNPPAELSVYQSDHIRVIPNPDENRMQELIQNAQINVLAGFQKTGLKLKLLHALFLGRHCVVNGIIESGLRNSVQIVGDDQEFIEKIKQLMSVEFTAEDIRFRQSELAAYNNKKHAITVADQL